MRLLLRVDHHLLLVMTFNAELLDHHTFSIELVLIDEFLVCHRSGLAVRPISNVSINVEPTRHD
jgi:hypothetical protein